MQPAHRGDRRRSRTGKGLLPPNPKQWDNEHNGLDLRDDLGINDEALDHLAAFTLLEMTKIIPHGEIPAADEFLSHFRTTSGQRAWSGLAIQLQDGTELVVYNDSHPLTRIRATLMEEFFHLRLGHARTRVRVIGDGLRGRSHDSLVESQAYGSGAAALVPYAGLKRMLRGGRSPAAIAGHFKVSRDLVVFRIKVTKLFKFLRSRT
jgi:hypothetical protein